METLNVKFNVSAGNCILHTTEVLNAMKNYMGEGSGFYKSLTNNKNITLSFLCIFDGDTEVDVRKEFNVINYSQPLLEKTFSASDCNVAQLISKNTVTGLISISISPIWISK